MRKVSIGLIAVCLALALSGLESGAAPKHFYITVSAGAFDRHDAIVSFALPKELKGRYFELREAGKVIPLQASADRTAVFVLADLKASSTKRYRIQATSSQSNAAVASLRGDKVSITAGGRLILEYQGQPGPLPSPDVKQIFQRGGYIHPVYAPSGKIVTDDYPPDHYHQHGVWFAWTKTEFQDRHPDFWNMGTGSARVEFVALDDTWSGPVYAGVKARHRYLDTGGPEPVTALNEVWTVDVYNVGQSQKRYSIFDVTSSQECAGSTPLILPEYRYGGLGFRGHHQWIDKSNCVFLTSEGQGREDGNGARAKWCHVGGKVDGQLEGVAILDHPGNFRAPQPVRLNPDQPFFCYSPSVMGQWEIAPGKKYVSRYRFVVYDGPPDKAEIDRLWNDYANPPAIAISAE